MSLHEGLDLDPTDPLYILITSYPDPDENPEGEVARNAIIGNLKKSLQGFSIYMYCRFITSIPSPVLYHLYMK
jgi:hypothetical protein